MLVSEDVQPWEKLEDESDEAFEAFVIYLDMGIGRKKTKVQQTLGKSETMVLRWSKRHDWKGRCLAFDRQERRRIHEEIVAGEAESRERQIKIAKNFQLAAAARLARMRPDEIDKLPPRTAAQMFKIGTDAERKARDIGPLDREEMERLEPPTFHIHFIPTKPENSVAVRLPDGQAGYIPMHRLAEFAEEFPDAVVIN